MVRRAGLNGEYDAIEVVGRALVEQQICGSSAHLLEKGHESGFGLLMSRSVNDSDVRP
jgi:hypothetical protein